MYDNNLHIFIVTLFLDYYKVLCGIDSGFDRDRLYINSSIHPRLYDFIRTFKWCFLFISLVPYDHDFISNVVIVIDSCGVFENYVFSICACFR